MVIREQYQSDMSDLTKHLLSHDSTDATYADESLPFQGIALDSLVTVARNAFSRLNGGHTYFRLARMPVFREISKYLMRHGPAAAFIIFTIYIPLAAVVLNALITSDLSQCKDSAACPRDIADTIFTACSVFTHNSTRGVICAYDWDASNRTSCIGRCKNWAFGNDSGICGVTSVHDNNVTNVDDDGTIISSTLSCIYPCNDEVCIQRHAPPYPSGTMVGLGILGRVHSRGGYAHITSPIACPGRGTFPGGITTVRYNTALPHASM